MTDWKKYYKDHLTDVSGAAKLIENGDCFWLGQPTEVPYSLLNELAANMENYHDVTLLWNVMNKPNDLTLNPEAKKHFKMMSAYMLPLERMEVKNHTIETAGTTYDYLREWVREMKCNGIAIHVCPPDENGYCNVGHYGVITNTAINKADHIKKKIAFIDSTGQFPIPGDYEITSLHITEFDAIVEEDTEFVSIPTPKPSPYDEKIASYILPYINEGDKVQIGYGGLGEEILSHLRDVGKMEIYSEVFCDTMADLCEEGVLTKIVAASPGACSERFMKFISQDSRAVTRPMEEMIDPFFIMKQDNIVAINATFQIDLLGQCCSEAQGLMPYTGPGGSFAYIYGATRAKGGRSFVCLRSTHNDKQGNQVSNIHPWLPEGCIVTTPKVFIMYLVTEYGVADVYLKSLPDRIKAILKIAHPDYREDLKEKILTTPLISADSFDGYDLFDNVER